MYVLRYMNLDDIPQVLEVDKLSFPSPWSARSYYFEITDNQNSHMIVLASIGNKGGVPPHENGHGLMIRGYGGMWFIDGEAHISTIAVHPEDRGNGLGEVLLTGMLARALALEAEYSVLEVRVSNTPAINLYQKYGYEIVGHRRRYYRDNNEDAYLMHLAPLDTAYRANFQAHLKQLAARVQYIDLLAQTHANSRISRR